MKILAFHRPLGRWPQEAERCVRSDNQTSLSAIPTSLIADSATIRHGFPMFVPDFARSGSLQIWSGVVVDRLGKWIEPRFAGRYYSKAVLAVRLALSETPDALSDGFDGSLYISRPFPASLLERHLSVEARLDGSPQTYTADIDGHELHASDSVALASRFMTLRTGDTLLLAPLITGIPLRVGSRLEASLGSQPAISLKIK